MCGHGTIGAVTLGLEHGLIAPRAEGEVRLDTPAGLVVAAYERAGRYVERVRLTNVASYLALPEVRIDCPELGELVVDIAYGGNFYAIVEPQPNYAGLDSLTRAPSSVSAPSCAGASTSSSRWCIPRTRRSAGSPTSYGPAADARSAGACPQCRLLRRQRRSIAAPAAPAPRRAWPSSRAR